LKKFKFKNSKGISVLFLVIAMMLMVTIGYVFSYLIPTKQKSVVFPIQSTQAFFIAQSGVEFAVRFAMTQVPPWTTTVLLNNLNTPPNNTRTLGAGGFTISYTPDVLTSRGEVPIGTERRRIVVSNFTRFLMSIGYFGSASTPLDGNSNTTNPTVVTPPGGMQAGDLVLMIGESRTTTANVETLAISNTGGQTWTSETQVNQNNCKLRLFWCRFNGAWTPAGNPNPSVSFSGTGTNQHIVVMHVFRPSNTSSVWQVDVPQVGSIYAAPGGAHTVINPSITTITDGALVFAAWASSDNNTWGNLTAGWTTPGSPPGSGYYRNNSNLSQTHAYRVMATAGATNPVSKDQLTLGGDAGARLIIAFKAAIVCP
jgi:hypothetical protein